MMFGQPLSMYIMGVLPTVTTRGWPSWPRRVPLDCDQTICRPLTFAVVMSFSRLCRVRAWSPPGAAHRSGSLARSVTSSLIAAVHPPTSARIANILHSLPFESNCIRSLLDSRCVVGFSERPAPATAHPPWVTPRRSLATGVPLAGAVPVSDSLQEEPIIIGLSVQARNHPPPGGPPSAPPPPGARPM